MTFKLYCIVHFQYRLRTFTLNCWGVNIPPLDSSEYRLERMEAIADHIVKNEYDLVFLQVTTLDFFLLTFQSPHKKGKIGFLIFKSSYKFFQEIFDQGDQNNMIERSQSAYPHTATIFGKYGHEIFDITLKYEIYRREHFR